MGRTKALNRRAKEVNLKAKRIRADLTTVQGVQKTQAEIAALESAAFQRGFEAGSNSTWNEALKIVNANRTRVSIHKAITEKVQKP